MDKRDISEFEDIINMPHHVSMKHPQMSTFDRAAQFSPFAALTGHSEAIKETERLTEKRRILTDERKAALNEKLDMLCHDDGCMLSDITVTYFVEDDRKEGGEYRTLDGKVMKVDCRRKEIVMEDGTEVPMEDIYEVDGGIFMR